jgi:hypothetical protein
MIHETTEGIEFESSEPGKGASVKQEPDCAAAYDEMMTYFHRLNAGSVTGDDALRKMRECRHRHTPKPETLAEVVLEFAKHPGWSFDEPAHFNSGVGLLFSKMRDLAKKETEGNK